MEDNWINELRNIMEDHQADIPEGLWDDIEKEIFPIDNDDIYVYQKPNHETGIFLINRFPPFTIAAVFVILMTMGVFVFFWYYESEKHILYSVTAVKTNNLLPDNSKVDNINSNKSFVKKKYSDISKVRSHASSNKSISVICPLGCKESPLSIVKGISLEKMPLISRPQDFKTNLVMQPFPIPDKSVAYTNDMEMVLSRQTEDLHKKKVKNGKWFANLLTGNLMASQSSDGIGAYGPGASIIANPVDSLGPAASVTESETKQSIRRKIPLIIGFSLQRSLNQNWSISTGMSYTSQSTEFRYGSESNYISTTNKKQQLIIPIQVNRNIVKKVKFTGYAHGGINFGIPVSDNTRTSSYSDGVLVETAQEKNDNMSLQYSLNAGLGGQLKLSKKVGLYAEPTIEYHLGSYNSHDTFQDPTKIRFNMRMGLRIILDNIDSN